MSAATRDRIVGFALLLIALAWSGIVYMTIPTGQGGGDIGPRAFPLLLGILLAVLSAWMVIGSFRKDAGGVGIPPPRVADDAGAPTADRTEIVTVLWVLALIVGYGFLMEKIGFLLATPVVVAVAVRMMLGVRRVTLVLGLALGITIGSWVMFGKILGAYLPPGTWISIGF